MTSIVSREGPKFHRIFYRSVEEQGEQNDSVNSYFPLFLAAMKNLLRFIAIFYQIIYKRRPKAKSIFSFSQRMLSPRVVHDFGKLPTKNGARVSRRG